MKYIDIWYIFFPLIVSQHESVMYQKNTEKKECLMGKLADVTMPV